jgi:hypothetical protein
MSSSDDEQVLAIRQALPTKEAMQIVGPDTQASSEPAVTRAAAAPQDAPYAKFYVFTRDVRDGVNAITASVLGTVWYIVHTRPTSIHEGQATWGPYTDSLEPATYRFVVTRTATTEYSYILQGRAKESSSEQDYRTVLSGVGYSKDDPKHGDGNFTVDLDTARALDPVAHRNDSGVISVVHDLPATVTEEFVPLPRTIQVTLAPTDPAAHLEILSIAREDNTGTIVVDGQADIDESKKTLLEDVTVASQWDPAGAGRSDVSLSGGDVPASVDPVTLVECWDTHFKQSYYRDSAGISTTVGDVSGCAFSDPVVVQP